MTMGKTVRPCRSVPRSQPAQVVLDDGANAEPHQLAVVHRAFARRRRAGPCRHQAGAPADSTDRRCRPAAAAPGQQVGQRCGSIVQCVDRRADGVTVVRQPGDQLLELIDSAGELGAILGQGADNGVEVVDQLLDGVVVVGQRIRERRRLGEQRVEGAALALKDLDQRVGQRVDIVRIQALDNRFESAEQQIEIQRRLGAVERNLAACGQALVEPGPSTSSR